ncbi:TIGR01244 family sulfur transferase [Roseovarius sp.]|uniref:TIGR01244 family sulfur transferase n=1 Tax=Roseovarius sp. TaxID=1486281 RepID=UPI000C58E367|nr:TIGR01244 family sulfur transferase [Roseovarius sp.]MAZ20122.1 TIGR01244 family phosphatase [Roseovarius sp.]
MDLRKITDDFAVAPQILPEDVAEIAKSGYRSIICNRPDNEEYGQCDHCDVETEARKAGMEFLMLPIVSGVVTEEAADRFRQALDQMPGPILAYCRSGTRCTMLWTIANFDRLDPVEIVERTEQAGYDMRGIISQLQSMQGA